VLYAPGISTRDEIRAVCSWFDRPVNVLAGRPGMDLTVDELAALGVRRISVVELLARTAIDALLRASKQMKQGSFAFAEARAALAK
jgi:2-methylisocitrate lyase-like PEP mutase family enzyme